MSGSANTRSQAWEGIRRLLVLLPALVVGLSLAITAPASAQTSLRAGVSSTQTLPEGLCANGAYICGTANLAGYGAASWDMFVTGFGPDYSACGSTYSATIQLTLSSDPASTLVLDEAGNICGLGHDGAAYRGYFAEGSKAFGHPFTFVGSWTVDAASTGQFAGRTGSGTDLVDLAGAHAGGSYTGTFGS
jgi:hypothetical protein